MWKHCPKIVLNLIFITLLLPIKGVKKNVKQKIKTFWSWIFSPCVLWSSQFDNNRKLDVCLVYLYNLPPFMKKTQKLLYTIWVELNLESKACTWSHANHSRLVVGQHFRAKLPRWWLLCVSVRSVIVVVWNIVKQPQSSTEHLQLLHFGLFRDRSTWLNSSLNKLWVVKLD